MAEPTATQGEKLAIRALDRRIETLEKRIAAIKAEIAAIQTMRTRLIVRQEVDKA